MHSTERYPHGQPNEGGAIAPIAHEQGRDLLAWFCFIATFAFYLLSIEVKSDGQLLGNDALPYAYQLANGMPGGLFNAAHLLFHPLVLGIAKLLAYLPAFEFNELTVLFAQQCLSAAGGALSVVMVLRFAKRCAGRSAGIWIAAIYACCYSNWLYSAVGETYAPATAFVAVLLVQAAEVRLGWRRENVLALTGWLFLAVCLRQDSVLVICALPFLLQPKTSLTVIGASGALAFLFYVTAWSMADLDQPFVSWLRNLSEADIWGNAPTFESLSLATGLIAASIHSGIIHLHQAFAGRMEWSSLSIWSAILSISVLGMLSLLPSERTRATKTVLAGFALYFVVRFGFFTWWQPANLEFHNGTLLPVTLIAVLLLRSNVRRMPTWPLPLAFVLIAVGNLTAFVLPNRAMAVSLDTATAVEAVGPGGMIVALNANQYHALLREPPSNVTVVDGVDIFVRNNLERLPALMETIQTHIESGKPVMLLRELGIWSRMGFPERPINMTAIDKLVPLYRSRPLLNDEGDPWALILEP
ncbi:MAG: hypothetical protein ACI8TQ_001176 [Planctomycetota bacterium]